MGWSQSKSMVFLGQTPDFLNVFLNYTFNSHTSFKITQFNPEQFEILSGYFGELGTGTEKENKILTIHWSYFLIHIAKLSNAVWILKSHP